MKPKIDRLDTKILSALGHSPRMSMSEMSRKVKHGRDIVAYRFARFYDVGILNGIVAVINPFAFGFSIFKTYLRLRHQPKRIRELIEILNSNPYVFCIAQCEGQWDVIFNVVTQSAERFDEIQDELLTAFRDVIITSEFAIITKHQTFLRVPGGESKLGSLMLRNTESICRSIDNDDIEILNQLASDARVSIAKIAQIIGKYPQTVERRIEHLESAGIISGYRLDFNRTTLEQVTSKVQLVLSSYTKTISHRINKFCDEHREIYKILHQLGSYKYELGIAADSYESLLECMDTMRSEFQDVLRESTSLLVRKEEYLWNVRGVKVVPDLKSIAV